MRLAFFATALLALVSCKQGQGEYCQVNADCEDGLVCAQITDTCEKSAAAPDVDAGPDAEIPDAEVPDSAPPAQCADGDDNDGDLQTDFPNDPECTDATDDDESA